MFQYSVLRHISYAQCESKYEDKFVTSCITAAPSLEKIWTWELVWRVSLCRQAISRHSLFHLLIFMTLQSPALHIWSECWAILTLYVVYLLLVVWWGGVLTSKLIVCMKIQNNPIIWLSCSDLYGGDDKDTSGVIVENLTMQPNIFKSDYSFSSTWLPIFRLLLQSLTEKYLFSIVEEKSWFPAVLCMVHLGCQDVMPDIDW